MRINKFKKTVITLNFLVLIALILGYVMFFGPERDLKGNGTVNVDFKLGNNIKLKNILAVTDTVGKKLTGEGTRDGIQGYLEFTVNEASNRNVNYEIYVTKDTSANEINSDYIKLYLTDGEDEPVKGFQKNYIPSFDSLKVASDNPNGKVLYRGKISPSEEKNFKLRVWLSDSSPIEKDEKDFSLNVGVRTD